MKIITLPYLRTLCVEKSEGLSVSHLFPMNASHRLHTLEIVDTYCSAMSIQAILCERHATELKRLVLRGFCATPDCSCQPIIDALVENCHKLEYLELDLKLWFEANGDEIPLRGFHGLANLRTLRIGLGIVVDTEDPSVLPELNRLLPPKLHALHMTGIKDFALWRLVSPSLSSGLNSSLISLAESCLFKEMSITIDFDEDLEVEWAAIRDLLVRTALDLWARMEISCRCTDRLESTRQSQSYLSIVKASSKKYLHSKILR